MYKRINLSRSHNNPQTTVLQNTWRGKSTQPLIIVENFNSFLSVTDRKNTHTHQSIEDLNISNQLTITEYSNQ